MKQIFFFFLFILFVATGCKRLPNVQGNGEALLQGVWNQDSVANSEQLLSYTLHGFKFTCDSFYVTLTTHTKVNYHEDSCFNNGVWKEYAKGTYLVNKDTLILIGTYTKANFKQKISGCYTIGRYLQNFVIKKAERNQLALENLGNHMECILDLKEAITCVPKAL